MWQPTSPEKQPATVYALGLAVAFSLLGDTALYAVLPVEYASLGLTAIQVGLILSANRWVRLVTNDLARRLITRSGGSAWFRAALAVGAGLTALYAFQPSFPVLLAARLLWGLCWSLIRHAGVTGSVAAARPGLTGAALGLYGGLIQLGFIGGTILGGTIFDIGGLRATFLTLSVLSMAGLLWSRKTDPTEKPRGSQGSPATSTRGRSSVLLAIRGLLLSCVSAGLIMSTLGRTLRVTLGETIDLGWIIIGVATLNGVLLAFRYVVAAAGAPLLGRLIDRIGEGRSEIIGFGLGAIALLVATTFHLIGLTIFCTLLFFVCAVMNRIALDMRAGLAGHRAYARMATAGDLGSAIGPLLGWIGISLAADARNTFLAGGLLFLAALVLAVVEDRRSRSSHTTATMN